MKTPKFWRSINPISLLLAPLSLIYWLVAKINFSRSVPQKFSTRIICVGNNIAGGAGKTPVSIMIGQILIEKGYNIAYACKNYQCAIPFPTKVTSAYKVGEVVEEAMLLSKIADTFVAQELLDALAMADKCNYDYIITDDGLQNNKFFKDKSIVVIDDNIGFGNNLLLPAGPLRETFCSVQKKVDFIVIVGDGEVKNLKNPIKPIVRLKRKFKEPLGKKYLAFTGIAYPEKFYTSLEKLGINVMDRISYPDHFCYDTKTVEYLLAKADKMGVKLITTYKDLIKIDKKYANSIDVLEIELIPDNKGKFEELLGI